MSYTKHNFQTGDVLYASQLREMDNKIYDMDADIASINETLGTNQTGVQSIAAVQEALEDALTKGRVKVGGSVQDADLFMDTGSYFVNQYVLNTPYHDEEYFTIDYANLNTATGYLFVFGHRDAGNASQNFLCQLFIEGPRDLTIDEALYQTSRRINDVTYSFMLGTIYTRYYNPSASAWSRWLKHVNYQKFTDEITSIKSRLTALEGGSSGGGGNSDEQGKGDEPQADNNE